MKKVLTMQELMTTNELLSTPKFKHNNEKLLFNYLTLSHIEFTFQKQISSEFIDDLIINFELQIAGYTIFIELVETPIDALSKKQHYKHHFTYPLLFCIDCAMPANAFYTQLVSIFTGPLPIDEVPTFAECLNQNALSRRFSINYHQKRIIK